MKSSVGVRKVNPKRRAKEWARAYGSKERVAFVKSLRCVVCKWFGTKQITPTENAHVVNGGRGRKADSTSIIPLCSTHHRDYDQHRSPLDIPAFRDSLKAKAVEIETMWRENCAGYVA